MNYTSFDIEQVDANGVIVNEIFVEDCLTLDTNKYIEYNINGKSKTLQGCFLIEDYILNINYKTIVYIYNLSHFDKYLFENLQIENEHNSLLIYYLV